MGTLVTPAVSGEYDAREAQVEGFHEREAGP